jgi:hypothetical protein
VALAARLVHAVMENGASGVHQVLGGGMALGMGSMQPSAYAGILDCAPFVHTLPVNTYADLHTYTYTYTHTYTYIHRQHLTQPIFTPIVGMQQYPGQPGMIPPNYNMASTLGVSALILLPSVWVVVFTRINIIVNTPT